MNERKTLEEQALAVGISIAESVKPELTTNEQAMFLAGFMECFKLPKSQLQDQPVKEGRTAEEILKKHLAPSIMILKNPDYTFNKVLAAMEEYRSQPSIDQGWVSVKDRLPESNVLVLAYGDRVYKLVKRKDHSKGWHSKSEKTYYLQDAFDLWLPLLPPVTPQSKK